MDSTARRRSSGGQTLCLVPAPLADSLFELLTHHFATDADVLVMVERRSRERRRRPRRAAALSALPAAGDRRHVRSESGRRLFERRGVEVPVDPRPLPRRARRHAAQITFVDCILHDASHAEDAAAARLVTAFQLGDRAAFTELYGRYFDGVYGYLRMLLRDHHEAEDTAQQTFTKAFQALPSYQLRAGTPFRSWLYRIARNEALGHLRKHSRVDVEEPGRLELRRESAVQELPHDMLGWLSDTQLMALIERLPDAQRQALALRYIVGMHTSELAKVLGRSPQAVRKLEHRALRHLEERLTPTHRPSGTKLQRVGMLVRIRRAPVLGARRFALVLTQQAPNFRLRRGW